MADKREMGSFKPSILKDRFPLPHPRTQLHTPLKGNPECLSLPGGLGTPGPSGLATSAFCLVTRSFQTLRLPSLAAQFTDGCLKAMVQEVLSHSQSNM